MNVNDETWATLLRVSTFAIAVMAGMLIAHGVWLTSMRGMVCHPAPVLTDEQVAEVIMELEKED